MIGCTESVWMFKDLFQCGWRWGIAPRRVRRWQRICANFLIIRALGTRACVCGYHPSLALLAFADFKRPEARFQRAVGS